MNSGKHSAPATFPVRAPVADAIAYTCERLSIVASRLLELLVERHAKMIELAALAATCTTQPRPTGCVQEYTPPLATSQDTAIPVLAGKVSETNQTARAQSPAFTARFSR